MSPKPESRPAPSHADGGLARAARTLLASLACQDRERRLTPRAPERTLVDLTHNDYLGLGHDLELRELCLAAARKWPVGAGSSRLLGGEHAIYGELEARFAQFVDFPTALFLNSGYAANAAILGALGRLPNIAFFSDALNHASLIDGLRLTGLPRERRQIFAHNDLCDLRSKLGASDAALRVVVTESVFSMDGDRAPLAALGELCREHGASLLVDESHSIFCLDRDDLRPEQAAPSPLWQGRGLAHLAQLKVDQLMAVFPCGKGLAAQGAFVCGPSWLRPLLINTSRPFIFSTGSSPWLACALHETLGMSPQFATRRARLFELGTTLRRELKELGFACGASESHIIPVVAGRDHVALLWSAHLEENGVLARAVRPPTVPEGTSRLRLSLSAELTDLDVERILFAFRSLRARHFDQSAEP